MPTILETKQNERTEKANRLAEFFEAKKTPAGYDMTKAETEDVQAKNRELDALGTEIQGLIDVEAIQAKNADRIKELNTPARGVRYSGKVDTKGAGGDGADLMDRIDFGRHMVESKSYKERTSGGKFGFNMPDIEMKTVFSTTAGWDPFVTRLPRVQLSPQQQPKIVEAFPIGTTSQHSIKYMLETTYTNNAAETAEGGVYPESALQLTEQIQAVVKVAVFLPITDEQLEDEEGSRDYVNSRLDMQIRQRLDSQLVNGTGVGNNLLGINSVTGILTQAKGTDAAPSALLKALTKVQTTAFCDPTSFLVNPTDWQNIRLLQTADGLYIWGHPSTVGPQTMWGIPVVSSTYVTAGTAFTGDLVGQTMLFFRKGISFEVSNSHSDWFAKGQLAIRAEMRAALVTFRNTAICKITGL